MKTVNAESGKVTDDADPNIVEMVPSMVSQLQMRKALRGLNRMPAFLAYLVTLTDDEKDEWQFASYIRIDSPMVIKMKTTLGLTNNQLNTLFTAAGKIDIN